MFRRGRLFLERPQIRDGCFDVVIGKLGRFHQRLVVFLHAFLDGLEGLVVGEGRLHGRVGVVARAEFGAHLGCALAIVTVAFGAVIRINRRAVSGESGGGGQGERERRRQCEECEFFHSRDLNMRPAPFFRQTVIGNC